MPGVVINPFKADRLIEDPYGDDGECKGLCVVFKMPAEGPFLVSKSDVAVDSAVYDVTGDSQEVLWGIIFHEDTLGREGPVADGVDVVVGKRADA